MQIYGPTDGTETENACAFSSLLFHLVCSIAISISLFRVVGFFTHSIYPPFIHIYAKISGFNGAYEAQSVMQRAL